MPELVRKFIKFPADWLARIDEHRGDESFSEFVREAVRQRLESDELSTPAKPGRPAEAQTSIRPPGGDHICPTCRVRGEHRFDEDRRSWQCLACGDRFCIHITRRN